MSTTSPETRAHLARLELHRDLITEAVRKHGNLDLARQFIPVDPHERDGVLELLACRVAEREGCSDDLTGIHGTLSALALVEAHQSGRSPGSAHADQSRVELFATVEALVRMVADLTTENPHAAARILHERHRVPALLDRRDHLTTTETAHV